MKRKYRLRSIVLFLSMCVSVFSACFCVLLMAGEYYTARNKLDIYTNESQGWEACRLTEPTYYEANSDAVRSCQENLEEAKNNYWVTLPKNKLTGLFVVAGLGSAVGGYLAVWSVWFMGLGIYRFVLWIKLCIENKGFHISHNPIKEALRKLEKDNDIAEEVEVREYDIEKAVEGKERTREEDLEHQVDMLREEVCSVRSDIEKKLSTIDESKADSQKG